MSDGPADFRRFVAPLDELLEEIGGAGWDALQGKFAPAPVAKAFDPGERIKRFVAAMARQPEGREFIEWIADLTCRAPYPHVGNAKDSVVIAAAKHEARVAVGDVVLKAWAEGEQLLNQRSHP